MQPFGCELVAVVGRHARTTAIANSDLLVGFGEGQVPTWSFAQKTATDSFGSRAGARCALLAGSHAAHT
jgi:hypothetical protein